MALPRIRWHHKTLDGSGYSDGLAGGALPRLPRILAVADIYDALTTRRSYKVAFSKEQAFSTLSDEAARVKLDKELVRIFIDKDIPGMESF